MEERERLYVTAADEEDAQVAFALKELAYFLPLVGVAKAENKQTATAVLSLGFTNEAKTAGFVEKEVGGLKDDGFTIRTVGKTYFVLAKTGYGILYGVQGVILLGLAAKAGTQEAFLDNTLYDYAIYDYKIDGQRKGALGICKTFFDGNGIPVLMSSGCKAACQEAEEEGIKERVVTKTAQEGWRNGANCRPVKEVHEELYQTAKRALVNAQRFAKTQKLVTVEIEFIREDYLENFAYKNGGFERVDARTLKKTVEIDSEIGRVLV